MRLGLVAYLIVLISQLCLADVLTSPHFYSVKSKTGRTSYLFGTIHGGIEFSEIPDSIIEKLNSSKTFIAEWDFSPDEVSAVLSGNLVEEQLRSFRHKGDELTPSQKSRLINEWGVDARLAEKAKSADCSLLSFGGPISTGFMDFHLINLARNQNKKILALDSEEQFIKLNKLYPSKPCDIRNFLSQLTPEQFRSYQKELIEEYKTGEAPFMPETDPITSGRNRLWIPKLLPELNAGHAFITVGNAHLYGKQGLIKLLTMHGYRVTRLTLTNIR